MIKKFTKCIRPYFFNRYSFVNTRKINQQQYRTVIEAYRKNPTQQTLRQYWQSSNLIEIFNIVRETGMPISKKIQRYQQVEQLCLKSSSSQESDMEFNVLANLYTEKSKLYLEQGQISQAIVQIERAIEAIQNMQNPLYLEVAMIFYTAANLHIQVQQQNKALKYLQDSQNYMNIGLEQMQEYAKSNQISEKQRQQSDISAALFFAKLYSSYAFLYINMNQLKQSAKYTEKALVNWQKIPNRNIISYMSTIRYQCILKIRMKQQNQAIQIAQNYLLNYEPNQQTKINRLWFMKFLADRGLQNYKDQFRENLQILNKKIPAKQLESILVKNGIMSPRKKQKQPINK